MHTATPPQLPSLPWLPPCPAAAGAVKGIGKGLLGAVASPMSGVLDALRWVLALCCLPATLRCGSPEGNSRLRG